MIGSTQRLVVANRLSVGLVLALVVVLCLVSVDATASPAGAATVVVTTTADSGAGSLREAIATANASPGLDTITFAIPGSGVQTIQPLSALPTITDPVVVDGASQPGYVDRPLIELSGATAGSDANGLTITAGGSTVRALTINRFSLAGLSIVDAGGNIVEGCLIGTTSDGSGPAGNGLSGPFALPGSGIDVSDSPNNRIGGTAARSRNTISGNSHSSIKLLRAPGALIQGNFMGTTADGLDSIPNQGVGTTVVLWIEGSEHVLVGGTTPEARNVIGGSPGAIGISIGLSSVRVEGNYIGLGADGRTPLPNLVGVAIIWSSNVTVGGTNSGAGNLIAGNLQEDVGIHALVPPGETPATLVLQGNRLGVDIDGAPVLRDKESIVFIGSGQNVEIGGLSPAASNVIAGGRDATVQIHSGRGTRIMGNAIYGGSDLAIDLVQAWPGESTPNDPGDTDDGSNDLQNFPIITSVGTRGSATTVAGRLDSRPSTTYRVELFAGMANPPSGRGEPKRFLGAVDVTTDASGNGTFATGIGALAPGEWVSATATGPTSGTSEVSPAVAPTPANVLVTPTAGLHTSEAGGTATFTVALATVPSRNVVVPLASTSQAEGTVSPAALTFTPADALTPKTVTVRGADDAAVDGPKAFAVTLGPLQTDDPTYAGLDPSDVAVTSVRDGPGRLRVTVSATSNALTPDNRLTELRFKAPAGVEIDVAGTNGRTATFTAALPDRPTSTSFLVRGTPSTPMTVPFDVVDACTPWSTFVGDGGR